MGNGAHSATARPLILLQVLPLPNIANCDSAENPVEPTEFDVFRLLKGTSYGII